MRCTLTVVAFCLMGVAAGHALEIEVARPPGVDFSAYQSFGFRPKDGIAPDHPLGENSALLGRVRETARKTLLKRGMTFIEGATPDLWITFYGLGEEELTIEGTSKDLGPVTWVGDPGAHSSRTVIHRTLVVEVHDSKSRRRVWSGWATDESANREKLRARAAKVTRKILEELPRE